MSKQCFRLGLYTSEIKLKNSIFFIILSSVLLEALVLIELVRTDAKLGYFKFIQKILLFLK